MKYLVDIDAFISCLDCLDSIKVNGNYYIGTELLKEFIQRFPKEEILTDYLYSEDSIPGVEPS